MANYVPPARSKRRFSTAFDHYSHKTYIDEGTKMEGTCNYCDSQIRGKAGVSSNFLTHLRRKHPEKYEECVSNRSSPRSLLNNVSTAIPAMLTNPILTPPTSSSSSSSIIITPTGPSSSAGNGIQPVSMETSSASIQFPRLAKQTSTKHALISTLITKMIITDILPLQIVEGKGFQELLQLLDPSYTGVTLAQLKQSILPWYITTVEQKIQSSLSELESYVLTIDIWNANSLTAYVGLSVSFFTPEWVTKTVLLTCSCMTGYDRLQKVPALLKEKLQQHNITSEPHCIVLNNLSGAGPGNQVVNLLGTNEDAPIVKGSDEGRFPLTHVESFSSLLYDSIREGLVNGLVHYKAVLDSVAMIISEIRKSQEATEEVFGGEIENSKTDITWILHLILIRCMLKFNAESANNLKHQDSNEEDSVMDAEITSYSNDLFTVDQKTVLAEIVSILELFEEAVDMMETKSLPVSMCLPSLVSLKNHLVAKSNGVCSKLALSLLSSINTNFTDLSGNPLYVCSAVLDPRFKLSWCVTKDQSDNFKAIVLKEAQKIFDASNTKTTNSSGNTIDNQDNNAIAKSKLFSFISSRNTSDNNKLSVPTPANEFDSYLKDSQDGHDPCMYWRARCGIYPTLYQLAKLTLCLPASPTTMSKVFTQSSTTLNEDLCYSWMPLDNLETLLFLKANATEFQLF